MPVQYKDYYQVLGLAKGAPQEEIRKAFRKLARQHHPDVAKDKKSAEAKFREINEAYEVLGDPEKRKKYDELGANWQQAGGGGPQGWGNGGFGADMDADRFSDFFEAYFGGAGRQGGAGGRRRAGGAGGFGTGGFGGQPHRRDVEAEVHVTIEELLKGATKRVTLRIPGQQTSEKAEVNIPVEMVPGGKIRQKGKGQHGGDLVFRVILLPHAAYEVEGSDLSKTVKVAVSKLVLGGSVDVATPEGVVRLKLPAGTQPGRKFRLGGRGLPMAGKRRGDFHVQVQAHVPESLTLEERACWVKLQDLEANSDRA
jgi:curved DNA-binding protein